MGIVKLKMRMNFLMNLTHQLALLTVGAWYVLRGQTQIGTIRRLRFRPAHHQ
jgi:hypothetical protein